MKDTISLIVPLSLWNRRAEVVRECGYQRPDMFYKLVYPLHIIKQRQLIEGNEQPVKINRRVLESIMGGECANRSLRYLTLNGLIRKVKRHRREDKEAGITGSSSEYEFEVQGKWSEITLDATESHLAAKIIKRFVNKVGKTPDELGAYADLLRTSIDLNKTYQHLTQYIHITETVKNHIEPKNPILPICTLISEDDLEWTAYGEEQDRLSKAAKKEDKGKYISKQSVISTLFRIRCIHNKMYYTYLDPYNRLHHTITALKRELRAFLLIDGRETIQLDIKCSQPNILAAFVESELDNAPAEEREAIEQDLARFRQKTESGELYDFLMNEVGYEGTRDEFKKSFFKNYLYGHQDRMYDTEVGSIVREVFPCLSKFIYDFKQSEDIRLLNTAKNDAERLLLANTGYKALARRMQIVEGTIIRNMATDKLRAIHKIPHVVVFDEVILHPEHEELAISLLSDAFAEYGLKVSISRK